VRKCLRCCPLCGFLHAVPSLDTGHDSSLRKNARNVGWIFNSEHPASMSALRVPTRRPSTVPRSSGNAAPIGLAYVAPASDCR
jgi:hypothetical protein